MSQVRADSQAVAAALVGSLSSFSLVDVLDLLARAERTGELQVVGKDVDKRIWLDRGYLVEGSSSAGSAELFELACVDDGWFYFTVAEKAPDGSGRIPIATVIVDLGPKVAEWRSLVALLPFTSLVKMSSSTPAAEIQIRSSQWQLLSMVGAGRTVADVLEASPLHPLDSLRTLHELSSAMLISVVEPEPGAVAAAKDPTPATEAAAGSPGASAAAAPAADAPEKGPEFATRMPLPPFTPPGAATATATATVTEATTAPAAPGAPTATAAPAPPAAPATHDAPSAHAADATAANGTLATAPAPAPAAVIATAPAAVPATATATVATPVMSVPADPDATAPGIPLPVDNGSAIPSIIESLDRSLESLETLEGQASTGAVMPPPIGSIQPPESANGA